MKKSEVRGKVIDVFDDLIYNSYMTYYDEIVYDRDAAADTMLNVLMDLGCKFED